MSNIQYGGYVTYRQRPASAKKLLPMASKARPWVLIAVGVLILMDSGFDVQ